MLGFSSHVAVMGRAFASAQAELQQERAATLRIPQNSNYPCDVRQVKFSLFQLGRYSSMINTPRLPHGLLIPCFSMR